MLAPPGLSLAKAWILSGLNWFSKLFQGKGRMREIKREIYSAQIHGFRGANLVLLLPPGQTSAICNYV